MINSVIHHLGIALRDPKFAEPMLDRLFVGFLGLVKEHTTEAIAGWKGRGARFYIYLRSSGVAPGALQHLAFTARTRTEVDAFPQWAHEHGFAVAGPPQSYPEYGDDYYAVFFNGPEDLRFELVHLSESDGAAPLSD